MPFMLHLRALLLNDECKLENKSLTLLKLFRFRDSFEQRRHCNRKIYQRIWR